MKRALGICFLNNMGDNIVSWIACQELKRQFPGIIIDIVIPHEREQLYKTLNNYVDNVIVYPKKRRGLKNVYDEICFFRKLAKNNYDIGFSMDYKEATVAKLYTVFPKHVGANLKLFYKNPYSIYCADTPLLAGNFRTQMYLDNLKFAGVVPDYAQHLELALDEKVLDRTRKKFGLKDKKTAVYCPFGAGEVQDMRNETYLTLTRYLAKNFEQVYIIGGGINEARTDKLISEAECNNVLRCVNLGYGELAGLLKAADLFLSVDTGPMHLGDAVSANLVAMYGYNDMVCKHWKVFGKNSVATKSAQDGNAISHFYNYDPEIAIRAINEKMGK